MEKLTLNDGTELENSYTYEVNNVLYFYIRAGLGLADVFNLLIDPEKTKKVVCHRYGTDETYRGYKRLMSVSDDGGGLITATMRKA